MLCGALCVLYCVVLRCVVLCVCVLCCSVLSCTVLCCMLLCFAVLCCVVAPSQRRLQVLQVRFVCQLFCLCCTFSTSTSSVTSPFCMCCRVCVRPSQRCVTSPFCVSVVLFVLYLLNVDFKCYKSVIWFKNFTQSELLIIVNTKRVNTKKKNKKKTRNACKQTH